ncbi:peptidase M18, aminopeptidase I [Anaeromyces robustus]|jgi:aspartyl aminopeptidase|uniref:aspartyl aminopeptidase n=1 Tax=Anaeromyces robustus TaxID=1754192 RepID=A0A1Y1WSS7_9FUNG|nr:peptidase M18, aminopeptidase I [Anaeromyces robustus]|eukprot:ORX76590.1 peptidase M18, aminopeptidase I [Anaeromyces robustus]
MSATDFISFLNKCPSPYHVVDQARSILLNEGYQELNERVKWDLKRNSKYFLTRNKSAILSFAIGGKYVPGNPFVIIGTHCDSPALKVRPISKKEKEGILQIGVSLYGGGLWNTWFDRDLSLAGRCIVEENGKYKQRLVKIEKPLLRIPSLAIHLESSRDNIQFNKETHLMPIFAQRTLTGEKPKDDNTPHHPEMMDVLAKELNTDVQNIKDFDLVLYDTNKSTLGGLNDEFIFSGRLDNQLMTYTGLHGFVNANKDITSLTESSDCRVFVSFDHEEIGSTSDRGADSVFLDTILKRIMKMEVSQTISPTAYQEAIRKSFLCSADVAHAVHPNYPEKHESCHKPKLNEGMVIKTNFNQRYATTDLTSLLFETIAKNNNLPVQEFVVKNDSPCGSTIGPLLSSKLGIRTIDVGCAQLSMHSIRETGGTKDVETSISLFQHYLQEFTELDEKFEIDYE